MNFFSKRNNANVPGVQSFCDTLQEDGFFTFSGLSEEEANQIVVPHITADRLIWTLKHFFPRGSTIKYEPSLWFVGDNGTLQVVPACKLCGSAHPLQVVWTKTDSTYHVVYDYGTDLYDRLGIVELVFEELEIQDSTKSQAWVENQAEKTSVRIQVDYKNCFESFEISFGNCVNLDDIDLIKRIVDAINNCKREPAKMFEWAFEVANAIQEITPIGNEFHAWYRDDLSNFSCAYEDAKLTSCNYSDGIYSYSYSDGKNYSVSNPFASLMVKQRDKWTSRTFEHQDGYEYEEAKMQKAFNSLLEKYGKINLA